MNRPIDKFLKTICCLLIAICLLAAGRHMEHLDTQDDYLIGFLQNLGFSQFETDTYRTNPTIDSIAYGLAVKKIGDVTVLACAVCGGDYGME